MKKIRIFESRTKALDSIPEKQAKRVVIGDLKICLARFENHFFAIQDACPHSKASLSEGIVNPRGEIICPLHSYCFDLNTGREFQQQTNDAEVWKVKEDGEGIYIEIE